MSQWDAKVTFYTVASPEWYTNCSDTIKETHTGEQAWRPPVLGFLRAHPSRGLRVHPQFLQRLSLAVGLEQAFLVACVMRACCPGPAWEECSLRATTPLPHPPGIPEKTGDWNQPHTWSQGWQASSPRCPADPNLPQPNVSCFTELQTQKLASRGCEPCHRGYYYSL